LRHIHVARADRHGKSWLLANMIIQDLEAGYGVIALIRKAISSRTSMARVPDRRRDDVVVLDPADETRPVGLNPFARGGGCQQRGSGREPGCLVQESVPQLVGSSD